MRHSDGCVCASCSERKTEPKFSVSTYLDNRQPFTERPRCPACKNGTPTFQSCGSRCVRTSTSDFMIAAQMGDPIDLHLHVQCARCDFTWTSEAAVP